MSFSETRKPYVAGQFYPGDKDGLESCINSILEQLEPENSPGSETAQAVILPHAGYTFSAETALKTLLKTKGGKFSRAVIIAPSHRYPFSGLAASGFKNFNTPLGDIPVDVEKVQAMVDSASRINLSNEVHLYEHALEVELPLLQTLHPETSIIPFICGQVDVAIARELAEELVKLWALDTLWIISSDFTHYGGNFDYLPFRDNIAANLRELDLGAAQKIVDLDLEGFDNYVRQTGATICGANPIRCLLAVMEKLKAGGQNMRAELVDYTTSGAMTGDYSHCVSYAGLAFYGG